MKRLAIATLVALCCLAIVPAAFGEMRERGGKEFYFGDSFHKSPAGVKLTYLKMKWTDAGISEFKFEISAWKGKVVWEDMWFVGPKDESKGIVYKLSNKQKMNMEFCYLDCLHKAYHDKMNFSPAVGPFNMEKGQVWFVLAAAGERYYIVWDMASNQANWYNEKDKEAPKDLTK